MTLTDALTVLNAATLETHLLQIQVVATFASRTFRVLAPVVVHVVCLVGLINGETSLTTVLLVGRVLKVFSAEGQDHFVARHVPIADTRAP